MPVLQYGGKTTAEHTHSCVLDRPCQTRCSIGGPILRHMQGRQGKNPDVTEKRPRFPGKHEKAGRQALFSTPSTRSE